MENLYSVAYARDNLARLLHEAEEGTLVKITRRGKPVAVVLSVRDYERLRSSPGLLSAYEKWRNAWGDDIEEFSADGLRDTGAGRDVQF